ncbi:unnamed protein product [Closterium sp. NIES-64]|nr:unnamed protein product [Closterium sp. NIES-64]
MQSYPDRDDAVQALLLLLLPLFDAVGDVADSDWLFVLCGDEEVLPAAAAVEKVKSTFSAPLSTCDKNGVDSNGEVWGVSAQGSAGSPPATTSAPGSPWALPSSAEGQQRRAFGGTTQRDHVEGSEDAGVHTRPRDPHHLRPRSQPLLAADDQDAQGSPQGCAAGGQQEERRGQPAARNGMTPPRSSGGALSPRRPTFGERAQARTALDAQFRRVHTLPAAHDAHVHLHSSERATASEMGRVGAGEQGIGPRDEESRAAGALTAAANAQMGTAGETRAEQAIDSVWLGDRANGDDATAGPEIGSWMPRGAVNVVSAVIAASEATEARRDAPHGGSPARHHAPLSIGDEANVPGAPQPLRRSARRTPHAQAPARAADLRNGDESDQRQPSERQGRSRQDVQEEADGERDRSPRNTRAQEQPGDPSEQRDDSARPTGGRRGGGRAAGRGGRAAGRGASRNSPAGGKLSSEIQQEGSPNTNPCRIGKFRHSTNPNPDFQHSNPYPHRPPTCTWR